MNIVPIGSYVLLEIEVRGETAGGIALPETAAMAKRPRVVAVGPKVTDFAVGDYLAIHPKAQVLLLDEDSRFALLDTDQGQVMAVDRRASAELVRSKIALPETLQ